MTDQYTVEGSRLLGAVNDYTGKRFTYDIVRNSKDLLVALDVAPINRAVIRTHYVMIDKRAGDFKLGATDTRSVGEESYLGHCSKK